jgi:hypothetical protein
MEPAGARFVLGCSTRSRRTAVAADNLILRHALLTGPLYRFASSPPATSWRSPVARFESAPGTFGRQSRQRDEVSNQTLEE